LTKLIDWQVLSNCRHSTRNLAFLKQQHDLVDTIKIQATQGGLSIIIGEPGVGKSMLKPHIESWHNERDTTVVSVSRTMQTYLKILLL
jgi:ABC-type cobalamin/Fe3+-siderophores transport system ATPase subunit